MASTRRLAAILAADVAGYSRLMGADEEGTHERLRAHLRELVDPKIAEHRGRIVKNTGDGLLAEFPSVVDAVRCAAELQRAMADREATIPEDRRIRFRIGAISATSSSRRATSLVTGSMLRRSWRRSPNRVAFAFRGRCETRSVTDYLTPSRIWASRASRTLRGRCGSMRGALKPSPIYPRPVSR